MVTVPSLAAAAAPSQSTVPADNWYSRSPSLTTLADRAAQKDAEKAAPETRTPRDYMYLLLLAALLPLSIYVFRTRGDAGVRLDQTLTQAPTEVQSAMAQIKAHMEIDGPLPDGVLPYLPDDFYGTLPGHRIVGAMLARNSHAHWVLAAASAVVFFVIILSFFPRGAAKVSHLLLVGLYTASIGVCLLLVLQALADATRGLVVIGGIAALPFWLLKLLAGSYDAALDPSTNLFISAFGFTISVGLLEEATKAAPLIWHFRRHGTLGWRGACIWGLASGAAFGISEAILYSANFYNGIEGADAYLVRFLSCIALHAVWTGSVGTIIYQQRKQIDSIDSWLGYANVTFSVVVLSMLLHGLYDTFLKKEHAALALVTALASFVVLALQIEHMRKREPGRALVTA